MQSIHKHLTPDDFIIIVRPIRQEEEVAYEEGSWTGEVQVSIVTNVEETTLKEEEFHNMISASWEIGFNDYYIAVGSNDLSEAELITDETQIKEFKKYRRNPEDL